MVRVVLKTAVDRCGLKNSQTRTVVGGGCASCKRGWACQGCILSVSALGAHSAPIRVLAESEHSPRQN